MITFTLYSEVAFINEIKNKTFQQIQTENWDFIKSQMFPNNKDSVDAKNCILN